MNFPKQLFHPVKPQIRSQNTADLTLRDLHLFQVEKYADDNPLVSCVVKSVVHHAKEQAANSADLLTHKKQVLK